MKVDKDTLEYAEQEGLSVLYDEKLRKAIGSFGGKPTKKDKILNALFIAAVIALFLVEIFWRNVVGTMALDFAVLFISLKLIYLIHRSAQISHYQFWILTAIELKTTLLLETVQKMSAQSSGETTVGS